MGLSLFITVDVFMIGLMSQVVPIPTRVPLYRKEKLSGMYSVHAYYLSLWLAMTILLMQYPVIVSIASFQFLGFPDSSWRNMIDHMSTYILTCFVGSNFGFMWGCFFKNE